MTIDLRQWDTHQHDTRINPDGSIAVGDHELLDLKARLQKVDGEALEAPEVEWEVKV